MVVIVHKEKNHAFHKATKIATIHANKVKFALEPTVIVFVYLEDVLVVRYKIHQLALATAQQEKKHVEMGAMIHALVVKQEIRLLVFAAAQ